MITVSLSQIYDSISAHDNLDAKSVRGRYGADLETQPLYARTPFKYVTGDKSQKSYDR